MRSIHLHYTLHRLLKPVSPLVLQCSKWRLTSPEPPSWRRAAPLLNWLPQSSASSLHRYSVRHYYLYWDGSLCVGKIRRTLSDVNGCIKKKKKTTTKRYNRSTMTPLYCVQDVFKISNRNINLTMILSCCLWNKCVKSQSVTMDRR